MSARNKADPDPGWFHHEARIKSLYVEGKANLRDLIVIMAESHGFKKTKSQYESQFKIWGVHKYRKKDDWKSIGRNIAARERAGKESTVYINGKPISSSKVQKETRRHGFMTALEQNRLAPIPPIPDGFEIRTPAAGDFVPLTAIPGDTSSLPIGTETRACASSQLQIVSSASTSQTVTSDASLPILWNTMSPSPPMVPTDLLPIQSQNTAPSPPYVPGMHGSPVLLFEDLEDYFPRLNYTIDLPFCQIQGSLQAHVESSLFSPNAQTFGSKLILETIFLPRHHHTVSHEDVDGHHEVLKSSKTLPAVLKALLPSEECQMISSSTYHHFDSASSKIFTLLILAMANNFVDLSCVPIGEIMEYLQRQSSTQLLQHVLDTSGPESEAFAEKLFQAAILMEDSRTVKVLLQKGVVPNDLVCVHHGEKYTPLEYSCLMRNIEITKLLLNTKLDVNKSLAGEFHPRPRGAIACTINGPWWRSEQPCKAISFEVVHMLLEAGCNFSWSDLGSEALQSNPEVFDLLLDNSFETKTYEQAFELFFESMSGCDNARTIELYTRFLKAGVNVDHRLFPHVQGKSCFPIDVAAERENLELVKWLFHSGGSSTRRTLASAIKSKNKELIRFLLENGADVVASDESPHELGYNYGREFSSASSPLSEAIRWGDAEILDLLEEKARSRIFNNETIPGEFEDVLIAASVRGRLTTVQELLNYRPSNSHGEDLGYALLAAVCEEEEAIVLALLDAGANVNTKGEYITAVAQDFDSASDIDAGTNEDFHAALFVREGPAFLEALRQKNEKLVRLFLDADVDIEYPEALAWAVDWGEISIIEELIRMGIRMEGAALAISVEKKDIECIQLLLNAGAEVSSEALRAAVNNNDTECMQLLLNAGAEVNSDALSAAVTNNNIQMVQYLLSVGADPANTTALSEALPHGLPMIETLLTAFTRSYPHGKCGYGMDTFQQAIQKGDSALIKILLDANVNARTVLRHRHYGTDFVFHPYIWSTLLGEAIPQQHTTSFAILRMLLDEIGNPNIVVQASNTDPVHRDTALLAAIDTEDIKKVELFINAGANVNWPATKGVKRTPIQKSVEIGSYEITQLLIDKGGLVNNEPAARGGATALQLAAIRGYIGIAELLLEKRADVNAPSAKVYGRTALEGAAEHGRIDMLKLLYNAGAKFQGTEYETARELAKANGHMATWRYLETLYKPSQQFSLDT